MFTSQEFGEGEALGRHIYQEKTTTYENWLHHLIKYCACNDTQSARAYSSKTLLLLVGKLKMQYIGTSLYEHDQDIEKGQQINRCLV